MNGKSSRLLALNLGRKFLIQKHDIHMFKQVPEVKPTPKL